MTKLSFITTSTPLIYFNLKLNYGARLSGLPLNESNTSIEPSGLRLDYNANHIKDVRQYFRTRSLQSGPYGYEWTGVMDPCEGGVTTTFVGPDNQLFSSFYIFANQRCKGLSEKAVRLCEYPILTINDCGVIAFLTKIDASFKVIEGIFDSVEYRLIEEHYGSKRAKRSGAYFMNHIDEGMWILKAIDAGDAAMKAFCLHPIFQLDPDIAANLEYLANQCDPLALALAIEYRHVANNWLSEKVFEIDVIEGTPKLSPLKAVNDMLIADKVQNFKDFMLYHKGKHARSEQLDKYFWMWLDVLKVDDVYPSVFEALCLLNPIT